MVVYEGVKRPAGDGKHYALTVRPVLSVFEIQQWLNVSKRGVELSGCDHAVSVAAVLVT